jgi:putative aldouronate transport system permease protein
MFVWSTVWQQTGWGTIIFLSALSAVDPQLYESARMDGASKPQMMWYIDLPTILPVVTVVTLMALGRSMNLNFEKALLFQTPLNLGKSEVIQTFVYKRGILNYQIGFGAAVGLFNSIVNFVLIVTFNQLARRFGRTSLF